MYDINPVFPLESNLIHSGIDSLIRQLIGNETVIFEGYQGLFFDEFRTLAGACFCQAGLEVSWFDVSGALRPPEEIDRMIEPFLGGNDPLFGRRSTLSLSDFFNPAVLERMTPDRNASISIIYGPGASLAGWEGPVVYFDLPKNELQYRSRAGLVTNLGAVEPDVPKAMYKRFYFIDWIVLNLHKERLLPEISVMADGTSFGKLTWMNGRHFREALSLMSHNQVRVKPWFEPGSWGGDWIRNNIPGLKQDVPNYAWSFEMIVPENGIVFESSGNRLECSFDWLMYQDAEAVLGECHSRFGTEFPIRFDFLDTFGGGNLSIQCHPREEYIRDHFGERFTQQEAYYILDTSHHAQVNLGFREDIDRDKFRQELERSAHEKRLVDIPAYIQQLPAKKHDFFLIPEGTVHGSGINNLVLEISTTPYIFTFKMYDWLRMDLNGKPRDLNISRAFDNLCFDHKGELIHRDFISRPSLLDEDSGWQKYHLPTHPLHHYDVWRFHLQKDATVAIETENRCHVLNLVEGKRINVISDEGRSLFFNYAETFAVAAAARRYTIKNCSDGETKVVVAFIKFKNARL